MKQSPHSFFKTLRKQALDNQERAQVRAHLIQFMESKPLTSPVFVYTHFSSLFTLRMQQVALTALVILIALGGTSYAAERSLPGDLLYQVKIKINEPLISLTALSTKAEAQWEIERAGRRLTEAERLIIRGDANPVAIAALSGQLEKNSENIKQGVMALSLRNDFVGAANVVSNFEASLRAHNRILQRIGDNFKEEEETDVNSIRSTVLTEVFSGSDTQSDLHDQISWENEAESKSAAEVNRASADTTIKNAGTYYEKAKNKMDAGTASEIESQLSKAQQLFTRANKKLDSQDYPQAYGLFQQAHRSAQEAKSLTKVRKSLGSKINLTFGTKSGATGTPPATLKVNSTVEGTLSAPKNSDSAQKKGNPHEVTVDAQANAEANIEVDELEYLRCKTCTFELLNE